MQNPFEEINFKLNELLEKLNQNFPNAPPKSIEIINQVELSKRLGISKPTLIRWVKKGKIPCIKIGDSVRYNWFSVIESLEK